VQDVQALLPNGTIVQGRYSIENLLGRGGFGAVYLVADQRTRGNVFALKEITDTSKQERERFAFECEVLKRLDHRSLPRVYRVFEDEKSARAYMLMDYIEGPNLERLRQKQPDKRFALEKVLDIMAPIFDVVGYLHKQEPPIIHRDVKPANIIVPVTDEAVLVDLGIAKEYNIDATTTAIRRCSPGYGAPEQYDTGTNPRTDIYGLAATLYALLTGSIPTDAFYRMAQIGGRKYDPLEPVALVVPGVPLSVSDAIQKAMAINSADRFSSVEEFWQALRPASGVQASPGVALESVEAVEASEAVASKLSSGEPQPGILAAIEQEPVTVIRSPVRDTRRRGAILLVFTCLLLVALVGGLVVGRGFSAVPGSHVQTTTTVVPTRGNKAAVVPPTQRAQKPKATPAQAVRPTATTAPQFVPTPTPTTAPNPPTATSPPAGGQSSLAGSYNGSVTDQITTPATSANLTLSQVGQNGTAISGYAYISPPLQGGNSFTGTLVAGGTVSFLVGSVGGHLPLYFNGQIAADRSISGYYCSYSNGGCDRTAGGYGVWSVVVAG
jgi:eukaryotic-like serine/threonine-protein kinase